MGPTYFGVMERRIYCGIELIRGVAFAAFQEQPLNVS